MMRTARSKSRRSYDTVPLPDGRERHGPGVKIAENIIALTKKHIDFSSSIRTTVKKFKNLIKLCHADVIPRQYHNYYKNLNMGQESEHYSSEDEISLQIMRERLKKK
ncbi:hypothetical protein ILUMI_07739 [Ignelater luminosus]|uniref:Uncharacterized protein n=1 Tax=Ignelater luminosus TaxID=2038154 RepID=A0A8K0GE35_IGNLU|nr:hypothetical protein ILUMI_07739 [Ignelater luminosus]